MAQSQQLVELVRKRPRSRRRLGLAVGLVVVVAVVTVAVGRKLVGGRNGKASAVRTAEAKRGTIERTIDCTGVVSAETGADVKIGSQISGRIRRLYADLDKQVKAGQVIAEIDVPDLRANLEAAQRNLGQATVKYQQQLQGVGMLHTQLASAFEEAAQSVRRAEASRTQVAANLTASKSRLESARAAVVGAQARQRQAQAGLRSARTAVESQSSQTTTDVQKARAGLDTAQATQAQVKKTADLEVANSEAALKQAQSSADLAAANLKRAEALLDKGFVAAQDVDTQRSQAEVTAQQAKAAEATVQMTREKVAADLAAAQAQVDQAQATLTAAQAGSYQETIRAESVHSSEADVDNTKSAVDQADSAVRAAQADLDAAQTQVTSALSDLRSAQAAERAALHNLTQDELKQKDVEVAYQAMYQAKAQVKFQQAQLDRSYVRSPISGTVVSLSQQEGETVAASLAAPTLCEVVDLNRLQVDAYVDETDIGEVKAGLPASTTVDAYPDRGFPGRIAKVASVATVKDNVVTYQVTIELDKYPAGLLKPQMTADVHISLGKRQNVLLVPNQAVKQKRGGSQVVVLKEGKADVRPVKTGVSDEDSTEIVSGIQDGEKVVLAGFEQLGLQGFGSAAELPGFLRRASPFGPGAGAGKSSTTSGASKGGPPPPP
jgi:RND family efflux transporter MFP subunit